MSKERNNQKKSLKSRNNSLKRIHKKRNPLTIMQFIWLFGCNNIFFCKIFDVALMSVEGDYWVFILCGILPSFLQFKSIEGIKARTQRERTIIGKLYMSNLICIVALIVGDLFLLGGTLDMTEFFLRETTVLIFWFLSLSLVLIYNYVWWGFCAITIFMLTFLYNQLMSWYLQSGGGENMNVLCYMTGAFLCAAGLSFVFIRYRIKVLFCENADTGKQK